MIRALALSAALCLVSGCSGSGCSGMEPIPGGFPLDRRVENGIQARLTPDGVDFLENNLADIVTSMTGGSLLFPVPPTTQDVEFLGIGLATARVCDGGDCYINIEIRDVNLSPTPPNQLRVHMNVAAWTSDVAGTPAPLPLDIDILFGTGNCGAWVDTRETGSPVMPVTATVSFVIDTVTGYTELEFAELDATSGFEDSDVWIDGGNWRCDVLSWFQGFFVDSLTGALDSQLSDAVSGFTCLSCETPENCPDDATCTDGTCMRGDECVSTLLGVEGRMDLSSLAAMLQGQMDLVIAAGGYADAVESGLSLGVYGGSEPVEPSACVPHDVTPPPLGPVPISPVLHGASNCPSCTPQEAHLALGVSETFLNRFGWGLHQSGGLCIGVGGGSLPISSGMMALLMPSLRNVTWGSAAPLGIEVRPNQPPVFELGPRSETEPLLALTLPNVSLDFYVWAHDRYARLFRANMDLTVDLDVNAVGGELEVSVVGLEKDNLSIQDATLLDEDLDSLADAFGTLIEDMVTPMLGDLGAFALPAMGGFELSIPDGGIGYLEDEGEEFLTIYGSLALPVETSLRPRSTPVETGARIRELHVPPTESFSGRDGPRIVPSALVELEADAPAGAEVEWRVRVDGGFWSPWSPEQEVLVQDAHFLFQGRHRILAQARLCGEPDTADPTPEVLEVLIDTVPPEIETHLWQGHLEIAAHDMVTPDDRLVIGWRLAGEGEYLPVPSEGLDVETLEGEVEIRAEDEAGNVSVSRQALRGRLPSDPSSCGGCAATGASGRGGLALGLLLLAGLALLRRRRGGGGLLAALVVLVSGSGLACSGPSHFRCPDDDESCCDNDDDCENGRCCQSEHYCVEFTREQDSCPEGAHCAEIPALDDDCAFEECASCDEGDELSRGLIGWFSSVAVTPEGDVWAAGYAAGVSYSRTYGDLAVAYVEGRSDRVPVASWVAIDGVPEGADISGSPDGWRGGISEPGDDVGRYASIAVDSAGNPAVAYCDTTHRALLFTEGSTAGWDQPTLVDGGDGSDAGRYADLLILRDGRPAIAYMHIERAGDGHIVTRARYVEATTPAGTTWSQPVDLHVMDPTPCNMAICSEDDDEVCDLDTGRCVVPGDGCGEGCESGQACVGGECHTVSEAAADLPEGTGIWPELAQGPGSTLGVVFYDRTNGDLVGVAYDGAAWGPAQVLAGDGSDGQPVGDVGWAPSLFIDSSGLWHMSFVDGIAEDVVYLSSEGVREIIDGRSLGTHWDIRGDDSSIVVTLDGTVRVAYQDATDLSLWLAERDSTGLWTTSQLMAPGVPASAVQGFYVNQILAGSTSLVSAWYWDTASMANGVLLFWI